MSGNQFVCHISGTKLIIDIIMRKEWISMIPG